MSKALSEVKDDFEVINHIYIFLGYLEHVKVLFLTDKFSRLSESAES